MKTTTQTAAKNVELILMTALLLSGCASLSIPSAPPPVDRDEAGNQQPYKNLENRRAQGWNSIGKDQNSSKIIDETHIQIKSTGIATPCLRNDVEVVETDKTITITYFSGDIQHDDKLCTPGDKIIELYSANDSMLVETKAPIGNRRIIDGAE